MKILAAKFFLFSNLDGTTIILGLLAIIAAIISLYTSVLESKDKRRHFLGLDVKDVKKFAAYCSFILTLLTLIVQDKHDSDSKMEAAAKERKADSVQRRSDSVQRVNLATTIGYLDQTITQQKATLKSTDTIINRQKSQLGYQLKTLEKQQQAFDSTAKIIQRENKIGRSVESSIVLAQKTLDSVKGVLAQGKQNAKDTRALTIPLLFGFSGEMRFYTKNEQSLWRPGANPHGQIYNQLSDVNAFLDNNIKVMDNTTRHPLRIFLNNVVPSSIEHDAYVDYILPAKSGVISYSKLPVLDPTTFDAITIPFDIKYDPDQHFFQSHFETGSGYLSENQGEVEDFSMVVNHSVAYIRFRYKGKHDFLLEGFHGKQSVSVDHITIQCTLLRYGSSGQYQIDLNDKNSRTITDLQEIKKIMKEDVPDTEMWRYVVIQIDVKKVN